MILAMTTNAGRRRMHIVTLIVVASCTRRDVSPVTPPRPEPSITPEARAREFLENQISIVSNRDAMLATFAPDAIVLGSGRPDMVIPFGIGDIGPDGGGCQLGLPPGAVDPDTGQVVPEGTDFDPCSTPPTIQSLDAGGTADAVWFHAEVGKQGTPTTRVVELLTASAQWHVVAASFGTPGELQPSAENREIPGATGSDGPLTKWLGSTPTIGMHLAPSAIVLGSTKAQVGTTAAALASWRLDPMTLFQRAREIDRPTWAFAQGNDDHPVPNKPYIDRLAAQAFAVREPGGPWAVVLVQYSNDRARGMIEPGLRLSSVPPRTRNALVLLVVATVAIAIYDWERSRVPDLAWVTDEATAFERARAEGKRVVVVVTASWSVPCRELERTFEDPEVSAALAKDFVPLKIDVSYETDATIALRRRFDARTLPAVRVMTSDGAVVASIDTMVDARTALNLIQSVLAR